MNTRAYPRTRQEAFGPYAGAKRIDIDRALDVADRTADRLMLPVSLITTVGIFVLLAVEVL